MIGVPGTSKSPVPIGVPLKMTASPVRIWREPSTRLLPPTVKPWRTTPVPIVDDCPAALSIQAQNPNKARAATERDRESEEKSRKRLVIGRKNGRHLARSASDGQPRRTANFASP